MRKKRRKFTMKSFFEEIDGILRKNGLMPDVRVYSTSSEKDVIVTNEWDVFFQTTRDIREGTYLDIYTRGNILGRQLSYENNLGTYRCPDVSDDAFRSMCAFGAEFVLAAGKYLHEHPDDFIRKGYSVLFFRHGEPVDRELRTEKQEMLELVRDRLQNANGVWAAVRNNSRDTWKGYGIRTKTDASRFLLLKNGFEEDEIADVLSGLDECMLDMMRPDDVLGIANRKYPEENDDTQGTV